MNNSLIETLRKFTIQSVKKIFLDMDSTTKGIDSAFSIRKVF